VVTLSPTAANGALCEPFGQDSVVTIMSQSEVNTQHVFKRITQKSSVKMHKHRELITFNFKQPVTFTVKLSNSLQSYDR